MAASPRVSPVVFSPDPPSSPVVVLRVSVPLIVVRRTRVSEVATTTINMATRAGIVVALLLRLPAAAAAHRRLVDSSCSAAETSIGIEQQTSQEDHVDRKHSTHPDWTNANAHSERNRSSSADTSSTEWTEWSEAEAVAAAADAV